MYVFSAHNAHSNQSQSNKRSTFICLIKCVVDSLLENNRSPKLIANILRLETVLLRRSHTTYDIVQFALNYRLMFKPFQSIEWNSSLIT